MDWKRTAADIPTWELAADPDYYVEQWGLGSWAAYHGADSIGEPGTYGARDEASEQAEVAFRQAGPVQRATWAVEVCRAKAARSPEDAVLAEAAQRTQRELDELLADSAKGLRLGQMNPAQRAAVTKRALDRLQAELNAAGPAIAAALDAWDGED